MEQATHIFVVFVIPFVKSLLVILAGLVGKAGLQYIHMKRKQLAHSVGDHIIQENLLMIADGMGSELVKDLADGKISAKELSDLKDKTREVSDKALRNLYGFYKKDLTKWINERIDASLPKFARSEAHRFVSKTL